MTKIKTIRRDWLKKQIHVGNIEIRCNGIYTDDYAFDASVDYQRSDWHKADLSHFNDQSFRYQSGGCWQTEDGLIHWNLCANHYYECRLIKPDPKQPEIILVTDKSGSPGSDVTPEIEKAKKKLDEWRHENPFSNKTGDARYAEIIDELGQYQEMAHLTSMFTRGQQSYDCLNLINYHLEALRLLVDREHTKGDIPKELQPVYEMISFYLNRISEDRKA